MKKIVKTIAVVMAITMTITMVPAKTQVNAKSKKAVKAKAVCSLKKGTLTISGKGAVPLGYSRRQPGSIPWDEVFPPQNKASAIQIRNPVHHGNTSCSVPLDSHKNNIEYMR